MGIEGSGPLTFLGDKLKRGPPSISQLISYLEGSESYARFLDLIREFLPEYEAEILAEDSEWGRIAAFVGRFSDRYFPIQEMVEEYDYFVRGVPVLLQGVSYDDYHEMPQSWRPGYCLFAYLIQNPYEDENRTALADECLGYVSAELLQRVPQGGLSPETMERLVRGSDYEALGYWARILWHDTGNFFLDSDYEMLCYDMPPWDRETVEELTREWQQAERITQQVLELSQWLEEDPARHFAEMIDFLEEKMNEQ